MPGTRRRRTAPITVVAATVAAVVGAVVGAVVAGPGATARAAAPGSPAPAAVPSCDGMTASPGLTRDQLAQRYGIDALHGAGFLGAGLVVVAIEGTTSVDVPLVDQFLACQGFPPVTVATRWIEPASNVPPGNEATVDVETLAAMLPEVGTIHVLQQPEGGSFGARFSATLAWLLDAMDRRELVPDVVSMSIGVCEAAVTPTEVATIETQLRQLAEQGVWFVKSAGDAGSSDCAGHDACATSDTQRAVEYPTTSPWLTAVGGSQFFGGTATGTAVVWKGACAAGGGGTSDRVARPAWQDGVGAAGSGRAVPDVTALAGLPYYRTLVPDADGTSSPGWEGDGGTSLGTPLLAGGLGLVRQALRAAGLPVPAPLNPVLYEIASDPTARARVFTDVTVGDNDLYAVGCCTATEGYDLASGWGELDIGALWRELSAGSPGPRFTG